jgi:S1-C subfamily serine protease
MNLIDLVLLLALLYSVFRGFRQGALSQLAAFGGAVAGLVLGAWAAPRIAGAFIEGPGANMALVTLAALLTFILLGQGVGLGVGLRLRAAAARTGAAALDRTAGVVVGVAGLVLTVWLLGSVLVQGPVPALAQQVRESRVVAAVDAALPPPPDLFGRVAGFLDQQGFPQVFSGLGRGITTAPVPPTSDAAVQAAAAAGTPSTVQVQSLGCGGVSSGSGFVTQAGFVVTNAHVVAGGEEVTVRDVGGVHAAVTVLFDPGLDLAVLAAPSVTSPPIGWATGRVDREVEGATIGFPGGRPEQIVKPATVQARFEAVGRDIYGRGLITREVLTLTADVVQGDSGGPFVTAEGLIGGVVFAANAAEPGSGYALTVERVRPDVEAAIAANAAVATGACRF